MEGKGSFFVLLFIVAFLSLTLAILAGYVFFFSGNDQKAEAETVHSEEKIPKDEDLSKMPLFEGKKIYNLKNTSVEGSTGKSLPVIQVSVELKYFIKVKGIKNVEEKIIAHQGAIKELVGNYFLNMTLDEVSQITAKEKAKKELTKQINELLMSSEKDKKDIIYTVIFDEWFFQ